MGPLSPFSLGRHQLHGKFGNSRHWCTKCLPCVCALLDRKVLAHQGDMNGCGMRGTHACCFTDSSSTGKNVWPIFFKYALFTAVLLPVFLPSVQKLVLLLLVLQLKWLSDRSTYFYIVLFALCIMQLLCAVLLLFCSHEYKPCWWALCVSVYKAIFTPYAEGMLFATIVLASSLLCTCINVIKLTHVGFLFYSTLQLSSHLTFK